MVRLPSAVFEALPQQTGKAGPGSGLTGWASSYDLPQGAREAAAARSFSRRVGKPAWARGRIAQEAFCARVAGTSGRDGEGGREEGRGDRPSESPGRAGASRACAAPRCPEGQPGAWGRVRPACRDSRRPSDACGARAWGLGCSGAEPRRRSSTRGKLTRPGGAAGG